ncbi:Hypothetical predicted protein [Paramuricea clavata]|uniref:Uncharacterized protein n=1 Tax=Paramuricea clavata TaxID=317549 RepID=A0A6S7KQT6_PARCT|nr:Hypothetical predicted protein [Paramuricea clavata]
MEKELPGNEFQADKHVTLELSNDNDVVFQDDQADNAEINEPVRERRAPYRFGEWQSSRCWNSVLDEHLKSIGFTQTESDPCIYVKEKDGNIFIVVIHVDNIILAGKTNEKIAKLKESIAERFQVAGMGELKYILGLQVRDSIGWNCGLLYSKNASPDCVGFSDADWAGGLNGRKSNSGYTCQIHDDAGSWRRKKQTCVALSTAEAEYVALSAAVQEALWMRQLLIDLSVNDIDEQVPFTRIMSQLLLCLSTQYFMEDLNTQT